MKFVTVLLIAALLAGVSALTPEQKENLHNTNVHHIGNLDELARNCLTQLLNALEVREVYVRLGNAIKGGHSVMFEVLNGDANQVSALAGKYKLQVKGSKACKCANCCGRILLPGGNVVSAVAVPGKRQQRAGLPASLNPKDKLPSNAGPKSPTAAHVENQQRLKFGLDANKVQWYYDNNLAQISKMHAEAQPFLRKLIDDLKEKAPKTIIQLQSPVPNGHAVRYDLVHGNVSTIQRYASKCGLTVNKGSIVAPAKDVTVKNAEEGAESEDGHLLAEHVEQDDNGAAQPIVVSNTRNVVKALPDKWIKPATALLEEEEDDEHEQEDAFIEEATESFDVDDDEDAFLLESL